MNAPILAPILLRAALALAIFLSACSAPAPAVFAKPPALKVGPGLDKGGGGDHPPN